MEVETNTATSAADAPDDEIATPIDDAPPSSAEKVGKLSVAEELAALKNRNLTKSFAEKLKDADGLSTPEQEQAHLQNMKETSRAATYTKEAAEALNTPTANSVDQDLAFRQKLAAQKKEDMQKKEEAAQNLQSFNNAAVATSPARSKGESEATPSEIEAPTSDNADLPKDEIVPASNTQEGEVEAPISSDVEGVVESDPVVIDKQDDAMEAPAPADDTLPPTDVGTTETPAEEPSKEEGKTETETPVTEDTTPPNEEEAEVESPATTGDVTPPPKDDTSTETPTEEPSTEEGDSEEPETEDATPTSEDDGQSEPIAEDSTEKEGEVEAVASTDDTAPSKDVETEENTNDGEDGDVEKPAPEKEAAVSKDDDNEKASEEVPVSEAAMRQKMIETELNDMIDEMMKSEEMEEEDEMEKESYEALMKAAKEICYTRKYYDVSADKIIYFPSIIKTIVNMDLFEKAEEYYFDEDDEFPSDYSMGLRTIAFDKMDAEGDDDDDDEEMDDDMMERLSMAVQLTEDDLDELKEALAAAEAEDVAEELGTIEEGEGVSTHEEGQEDVAKTVEIEAPATTEDEPATEDASESEPVVVDEAPATTEDAPSATDASESEPAAIDETPEAGSDTPPTEHVSTIETPAAVDEPSKEEIETETPVAEDEGRTASVVEVEIETPVPTSDAPTPAEESSKEEGEIETPVTVDDEPPAKDEEAEVETPAATEDTAPAVADSIIGTPAEEPSKEDGETETPVTEDDAPVTKDEEAEIETPATTSDAPTETPTEEPTTEGETEAPTSVDDASPPSETETNEKGVGAIESPVLEKDDEKKEEEIAPKDEKENVSKEIPLSEAAMNMIGTEWNGTIDIVKSEEYEDEASGECFLGCLPMPWSWWKPKKSSSQ